MESRIRRLAVRVPARLVLSRRLRRSRRSSKAQDVLGRGGSAILAPDGSYLAGPLYDEEGILYAELDPVRLLAERQRFDPVGHYHRPDVLRLGVSPSARAGDATPSTRPSV